MKEGLTVGVLGGSFNPVHLGHLLLADYLVEFGHVDEVWLMLSPDNPLKVYPSGTPSEAERLKMLQLACEGHKRLKPCDVELDMPRPSYTVDSLDRLQQMWPEMRFRLVIGSDNWLIFDRWRAWTEIIERYKPIVYPRPGYEVAADTLPEGVDLVAAPVFDISSTFIRRAIASGHDVKLFLPAATGDYIYQKKIYKDGE